MYSFKLIPFWDYAGVLTKLSLCKPLKYFYEYFKGFYDKFLLRGKMEIMKLWAFMLK